MYVCLLVYTASRDMTIANWERMRYWNGKLDGG